MNDQILMNTTLTQIKGLVGIMMHGSIESEGEKINKTFIESLTKILELQQNERKWFLQNRDDF